MLVSVLNAIIYVALFIFDTDEFISVFVDFAYMI